MDEELAMRLHEEEKVALERMQRDRAAQEEASNAALTIKFDDVQARMDADALFAAILQEEEREQFSIDEQARFLVEIIAERKRFFVAQRAEQIKNKPPTKTQLRNKMITFLKTMGRFTYNQLKNMSLEEIQKLYEKEQKWINDFIHMDYEMVKDSGKKDESVKKQKLEDDAEKEELRTCLDIVSGDDIAINVESLATKYPIVDWNTHILTENMMYYQIIRADGSSKNYKIFSEMLDDFDKQDVVDLYRLLKESEEDEIWKGQQDYKLISWRLFDSCGVHVLLMDTGIAVHMMVEKKYHLTQEMLSRIYSGSGSVASASITTGGVSITTQEESTRPTRILSTARPTRILLTIYPKDKGKCIMQEPDKPSKNPRKAQIQMYEELAMRLYKEEKDVLERMQRDRAAQEEASNAALTVEFDDVQARMDADALLAARL
ncbi:hypothetical protein Tco_0823942 [Tanacetum coccineum]|uniref:Uncharacterized protein n=1 Tax=Tanacetum coccineum TaxID=301880 RepID=A0ABQ5ANG8_9ASTR